MILHHRLQTTLAHFTEMQTEMVTSEMRCGLWSYEANSFIAAKLQKMATINCNKCEAIMKKSCFFSQCALTCVQMMFPFLSMQQCDKAHAENNENSE